MRQDQEDMHETIRAALRDGHALQLTIGGETILARGYRIRSHKATGTLRLDYLDADHLGDEILLDDIERAENLGKPLADVLDERIMPPAADAELHGISAAWLEIPPEIVKRIDELRGRTPRERYALQAIEARMYRDARGW